MVITSDGLVANFTARVSTGWTVPRVRSRFRVQGSKLEIFSEAPTGLNAVLNDLFERFSPGNVRPEFSGEILYVDDHTLRIRGDEGTETEYRRVPTRSLETTGL
ncbi:MAG TPA: hypothetical protein VM510_09350 [Caulifigura sp.]|nr:hypothetical protein [Caulifigura sp.]